MKQRILEFITTRVTRQMALRFGISLILAGLLWGWVTQLQDPLRTTSFSSLPIQVNGLSDSMVLVTNLPNGSVEISGPKSRVDQVRVSDLVLSIDLSDITEPGTYRKRLQVSKPSGVDAENIEPNEVQIQVEEYVTQNFPITVEIEQQEDDARVVISAQPMVTEVTVSGSASAMDRVAKVVLPVEISNQTGNFQANYTPFALDVSGQRITQLTILPGQVSTFVELETRGRVVSVVPIVAGTPAEGFTDSQRVVVPDTVLVDGPPEILETLLFVNTLPVDISGATENVSQQVQLQLPEGVTVVEPANGLVEVRVAIRNTTNTSQTLSSLPIQITGLDPALEATLSVSTADIVIDAPQSVLQSLEADDVVVRVSVANLGTGIHVVQLEISVPAGVTLVSSTPATITVVISDPRASPEASPQAE